MDKNDIYQSIVIGVLTGAFVASMYDYFQTILATWFTHGTFDEHTNQILASKSWAGLIVVALSITYFFIFRKISKKPKDVKNLPSQDSSKDKNEKPLDDKPNTSKDEKHTPKVNGNMNLDFSNFILGYTHSFFLKPSDIVNLLISLIAIFVGMIAVMISLQPSNPNPEEISYIINWLIIKIILLVIGIIVIPSMYVYYKKMKKNHRKVFKIEKTIIQNYDCINKKDNEVKDCILEELQRVFTEINYDDARLIEILSKPCKE